VPARIAGLRRLMTRHGFADQAFPLFDAKHD